MFVWSMKNNVKSGLQFSKYRNESRNNRMQIDISIIFNTTKLKYQKLHDTFLVN